MDHCCRVENLKKFGTTTQTGGKKYPGCPLEEIKRIDPQTGLGETPTVRLVGVGALLVLDSEGDNFDAGQRAI